MKGRRAIANISCSLTLPKLLKQWFRGRMDYILTSEDPWRSTEDSVLTKLKIQETPDVGLITYAS